MNQRRDENPNVPPESGTDAETLEVMQPSALEALERANVDMLISTAKRYPRVLSVCKRKALELALSDPDTAAECFYKFERGGKTIEGPSIRLAEIIASTWQNIRAGSRTIAEGKSTVTAQAFCHDLENNVYVARETERKIESRDGKRYSEDMIILTKNANASIALRNSVFSVIPKAHVLVIYEQAKKAAVGDVKTLAERRTKALKWFMSIGIPEERILAKLGVDRVDDISLEGLENLTGMKTAINDKEISADECFPPLVKKGTIGKESGGASSTPTATGTAPAALDFDPDKPSDEIKRFCERDGVTVHQVFLYAVDRKLTTKGQTEIFQLADSKLRDLLTAWKNILPAIKAIKTE